MRSNCVWTSNATVRRYCWPIWAGKNCCSTRRSATSRKCKQHRPRSVSSSSTNAPILFFQLIDMVINQDWSRLIESSTPTNWRDVLVTLLTYTSGATFTDLCNKLGQRLAQQPSGSQHESLRTYVALCFICTGNLEQFDIAWSRKYQHQAMSSMQLERLIEKLFVLKRSLDYSSAQQKKNPAAATSASMDGPSISRHLALFGQLLANEGCARAALVYLGNLQTVKIEREWKFRKRPCRTFDSSSLNCFFFVIGSITVCRRVNWPVLPNHLVHFDASKCPILSNLNLNHNEEPVSLLLIIFARQNRHLPPPRLRAGHLRISVPVHPLQVYPSKSSASTRSRIRCWFLPVDIHLNLHRHRHRISRPCTIRLSTHLSILLRPRSCRIRNSFTVCCCWSVRHLTKTRSRKSPGWSVECGATSWCSSSSSFLSRLETHECLERSADSSDESLEIQSSESKSHLSVDLHFADCFQNVAAPNTDGNVGATNSAFLPVVNEPPSSNFHFNQPPPSAHFPPGMQSDFVHPQESSARATVSPTPPPPPPPPPTPVVKGPLPTEHQIIQETFDLLASRCQQATQQLPLKRKLDEVKKKLDVLYDKLRENKVTFEWHSILCSLPVVLSFRCRSVSCKAFIKSLVTFVNTTIKRLWPSTTNWSRVRISLRRVNTCRQWRFFFNVAFNWTCIANETLLVFSIVSCRECAVFGISSVFIGFLLLTRRQREGAVRIHSDDDYSYSHLLEVNISFSLLRLFFLLSNKYIIEHFFSSRDFQGF